MKLISEINENHKLIYDGDENGYYEKEVFDKYKITDFKSLYKMNEFIDDKSMNNLLDTINGYQIHPFKTYKTKKDELMLKFFMQTGRNDKKLLCIVSAGESQPGRYKIFLEGVWEILED